MPRERKWGAFSITEALEQAFENGKAEIETLYEEMDEWRNNMEQSEGLTQTQKFEEVEEATNQLESAKDNLESVDLNNYDLSTDTMTFVEIRKRGWPRHVRCTNAMARLEAVRDCLRNKAETEEDDEAEQNYEEQIEYIEEAMGELECIGFPGMF